MTIKLDENSHWNFAEHFTGREAAHLICGYDPSSTEIDINNKVQPVVKRLKKSYYDATKSFSSLDKSLFDFSDIDGDIPVFKVFGIFDMVPKQDQIWSLEMEILIKEYNHHYGELRSKKNFGHQIGNEEEEVEQMENVVQRVKFTDDFRLIGKMVEPITKWTQDYIHEFDDQKFSRIELSRWIAENNFSSRYSFSAIKSAEKALRSNERNTLLIIIGALCKQLKLQYDPLDSNTVGKVMAFVNNLGVDLSDPTIRDKLHKISDAVDHNKSTAFSQK